MPLFADLPPWAWALLAAALLLAATVLMQGRLLFGRTWRIRRTDPGPAAAHRRTEAVWLRRPGGVSLQGWLTLSVDRPPRRLLLWFGGRNEHVAWTPDLAGWLPDDCALLAFNYRGLGASSGWPGEAACVADAEAAAAWGLARLGLPPGALHLAGRSIGTGVAMQLAARRVAAGVGPAGVTLISPFQSLRAVLALSPVLAPLTPLLRSPLDSLSAARSLRCRVLVLLAERDRQVPHAQSYAVAEALRRAGSAVTVHQLAGTNHRSLARTPAAMQTLGGWLLEESATR
ncbi:alpha/beta hydrolase family protein [Roseateles cellulosilyticus]|uniref:Prolyl oligopeptidase family serine peptidase n=1 Tax=Pelomonas cellulosilytica TaxID=2906762 RepID=A0ABS8Y149_9BURK|nr:prolyl oligopeptidase family serine peptidase [Pelomonas sp. P8]MCE4555465.1 prolyl oligopeptidase family serine peptidase [Pelomonas sp. P8]